MKRDDDLIRTMLFDAEAQDDWRFLEVGGELLNPEPEENRRAYHAELLVDAGLVAEVGRGVYRLTNAGHDWLDAVRDDTIWRRTKAGAAKVGGVGLQMMGAIAMGYVKEKLAAAGIPTG